ncbi:hypothetical protein ACFPFP_02900 [Bradyrhizobium sp. GCM10023182]|uniref:Chorismate mutase n=1 Tax=Bradyrhizobium zhengyangense TaxID=2911009 RepID=A0ABS9LGJ5_9BRAD|nr:hypothetical protein [Bradyrhizobium zhengyangense]MCG2665877.1 hypothetical protein [Bradyrhizobium zhengyangense]
MMGLLDGINDPEVRAIVAERRRIAERVAEQMGVSVREACLALIDFETNLSHEGHELH